jgi:hypothetical protein
VTWSSRVALTAAMLRKISHSVVPVGSRMCPRVVSSRNSTTPKTGQTKYQMPSAHQSGIRPNISAGGHSGRRAVRTIQAPGSRTPSASGATARTGTSARPSATSVLDTPSPLLRHA